MTGAEIKALRQRHGWSQKRLGEIIGEALGRDPYRADTIGKWEKETAGQKPGPEPSAFLASLLDDANLPPPDGDVPPPFAASDSEPGEGLPPPQTTVNWAGTGTYAKVCAEMFELVATGVGMIGAAVGSETVQRDGMIIYADREALGAAWGKLAETNETFRRMLTATEQQGAYLAVALATGTTVGKLYRNHAIPAGQNPERLRVVDSAADEPAA